MNCFEARKIPIPVFLEKIGIRHIKVKGANYWYLSPFRRENKSSFKVNLDHRNWHDYGDGSHGDIVDLVCKLKNCSKSEALLILSKELPNFENKSYQSSVKQIKNAASNQENPIRNLVLTDLTDNSLINYITEERCISIKFAKYFCKQATFNIDNYSFKTLAFQNRSGGYALRGWKFKGNTSPNDITLINNGAILVSIFEGFINFLSFLELGLCEYKRSDYIVLNSAKNASKTVGLLGGYQYVHCYLDRDNEGNGAFGVIGGFCTPRQATDKSNIYNGFNDINDFLIDQKKKKRQQDNPNEIGMSF